MSNYNTFTSRNYYFISEETQTKIKNTSLCFLGCGLGANIALCATRLGFQKFILIDFDKIELTNLNRQPFYLEHLNENKVDVLEKMIIQINAKADIKKYKLKITRKNIKNIINKFDFCINTIDYSEDYIFLTDYLSKQCKIPTVLPMNIGFSSLVLIFDNNSAYFSDIVKKQDWSMLNILNSILINTDIKLPDYLLKSKDFLITKYIEKGYAPQIGYISYLTSALVINKIIAIIEKKEIKTVPQVYYLDLDSI